MPPKPPAREEAPVAPAPRSRRRLYLIIGAAVLLVVGTVAAWFLMPKAAGPPKTAAVKPPEPASAKNTGPDDSLYWVPITQEVVKIAHETNLLGKVRHGVYALDAQGFPRESAIAGRIYGTISGMGNRSTIIVKMEVRGSQPALVQRLNQNQQRTYSAFASTLSSLPASTLTGPTAKEQIRITLWRTLDSVLGAGVVADARITEFELR